MEPSQLRVHGSHNVVFKHTKQMRADCGDWQSVALISASNPGRWLVTTPLASGSLRTLRAPGPALLSGHRIQHIPTESSSKCVLCLGVESAAEEGEEAVLFRTQVVKHQPTGDGWRYGGPFGLAMAGCCVTPQGPQRF